MKTHRALTVATVFVGTAVVGTVLTGSSGARADDFTLPFQVPDRGNALRLVTEFEKRSKDGDWPGAVERLQALLDLPAEDPVVIRVAGMRPARFEGAGLVARRLFDALPPGGAAAWETVSRRRAEDLLARGLRLRREADLRDAARRYPVADVRRRAHDALAQLALVRADFGDAQFQLQSLLDATEPADRAEAVARLAFVASQAGDAETLARVLALAEPLADHPVPSDRGSEPLLPFVQRMADLLAGVAAEGSATRQFGGDAQGTGLSDVPPPPDAPRWKIGTRFEPGHENDSEDNTTNAMVKDRYSLWRPVSPVIAHGNAYVNNGVSLVAVNIASGTPSWTFLSPQQDPDWRDSFVGVHTAAVADGVVFAALATRVDSGDRNFDRNFYGKTILYPLPHRSLYAFDARTGEMLWSHAPSQIADRGDAVEVRKESVAAPPLVVGDDLIVATWTYEGIYDVRLVCYDRRTGATRWRTSLVQGQQELNLFGRPVKELSTSALAANGNRIYFSTGLGVAAAVEREDGRVAWLSAYPQSDIPRAYHWYETKDRGVTWWPSPVTATPDRVVIAPLDCDQLLGFDARSGVLAWSKPRREGTHRYDWYLGATRGKAYVLGTRLMAYDIATGNPVWTKPDSGTFATGKARMGDATGRGILTRDRVYVPTSKAIVAMSAATGASEQMWPLVSPGRESGAGSRELPAMTGDLVSADGALLIVTRDRIDACFREADLRSRVEARLAANPDDPQVALEVGEMHATAGRLDEAIRALERGFQHSSRLAPRTRDRIEGSLRRALYDARLARAELRRAAGDADGAGDDLAAAVIAARDKGDAVRALLLSAELYSATGRYTEAEAALRRVVAEYGDVVTATPDGVHAQAGALALFSLGEFALSAGRPADAVARWLDLLETRGRDDLGATDAATAVKDRLARLAETEGALVATAVRARAKKAFDAARAARDVEALDRVARLYPDPEIAGDSALAAAQMYLASDRPRDAVGVLHALLSAPSDSPHTGRALWALSQGYRAMGETARERSALKRLAAERPSEAVEAGLTGAAAAARELSSVRFRSTAVSLPDPRAPLTLRWQAGGADQLPPQVLRVAGAEPLELVGKMVLARAGVLQVVDAATGREVWQQLVRVDIRTVAAAGGTLVLAGDDSMTRERSLVVLGLSAADGRSLWRQPLTGRYRASEVSLGVMYLLHDVSAGAGSGGRPNYSLTAISLATGDLLATKSFGVPMLTQVLAAEDAVVLVDPSRAGQTRRALITLDGTTLTLRGRVDLTQPSSPFLVHPELSPVVVTGDGGGLLAAVNVTKGEAGWKPGVRLAEGRLVKALFAVPQGVIVSDDGDAVRRLDADTGREVWKKQLGGSGNLVYEGEAAEGGLVITTLNPSKEGKTALAVALDAATGEELWRTALPLKDENTYPHPHICASVVAFELYERMERGTSRSHLVLLDRKTGAILQDIEHPTIGKTYQGVVYGKDWIALSSANELAVYGPDAGGK